MLMLVDNNTDVHVSSQCIKWSH